MLATNNKNISTLSPVYKTLRNVKGVTIKNKIDSNNNLAKHLEGYIGKPVISYICVPTSNFNPKGIYIFVNKVVNDKYEKFNELDEWYSIIFTTISNILDGYDELRLKYGKCYVGENKDYIMIKELLSCQKISEIMKQMEDHVVKITDSERSNVVFFDQSRHELYKRIKTINGDAIDSMTILNIRF